MNKTYLIVFPMVFMLLMTIRPVSGNSVPSFYIHKTENNIGVVCMFNHEFLYTTGNTVHIFDFNKWKYYELTLPDTPIFVTQSGGSNCLLSGKQMTFVISGNTYIPLDGEYFTGGKTGKYIVTREGDKYILYKNYNGEYRKLRTLNVSSYDTISMTLEDYDFVYTYNGSVYLERINGGRKLVYIPDNDYVRYIIKHSQFIFTGHRDRWDYTDDIDDDVYWIDIIGETPNNRYVMLSILSYDDCCGPVSSTLKGITDMGKVISKPVWVHNSNYIVTKMISNDGKTFFLSLNPYNNDYEQLYVNDVSISNDGIYYIKQISNVLWNVTNTKNFEPQSEKITYYGVSGNNIILIKQDSNGKYKIYSNFEKPMFPNDEVTKCTPKITVRTFTNNTYPIIGDPVLVRIHYVNRGACDGKVSSYVNVPNTIELKGNYNYDWNEGAYSLSNFTLRPGEEKDISITIVPKKEGENKISIISFTHTLTMFNTIKLEVQGLENTNCTPSIKTQISVDKQIYTNKEFSINVTIKNNGSCIAPVNILIGKNNNMNVTLPKNVKIENGNWNIDYLVLKPGEEKTIPIRMIINGSGRYTIPIITIVSGKTNVNNINVNIINKNKNKNTLNVAVKTQIIKNELYVGDEIPIQVSVTNNENVTLPIKIVMKVPNNILITGSYMTDTTGALVVSSFNLPPGETHSISITVSASKSGSYTVPVITKVNDSSIVSNVMFFVHDKNTDTTNTNNEKTTTTTNNKTESTSTNEKHEKGICGPSLMILLSLIPLITRRKYRV